MTQKDFSSHPSAKNKAFFNNVQGMRSKETRNIQLACLGMIAAHFQGE